MPEYFECKKINKRNNVLHNNIIVNHFLRKTERLLTPPRICRSRPQSTHDNSPLPARYQIKNDNSPVLQDSLPDFERGFRPACEIKTGILNPRTTSCRPGISRSSLKYLRHSRMAYAFCASHFENSKQLAQILYPFGTGKPVPN